MKRVMMLFAMMIVVGTLSSAQEPQFPSPQTEHDWLKQFTGEWTSTSTMTGLPDQPAMESTGSMKSRMLGGFWLVNEMRGHADGTTFDGIQTIGYDATKQKYVGTWVDSMTDYMWNYEGSVDASGKKLELVAEGPNFMSEGKLTKFRDSYEFKTPDVILATSEMMTADGNWMTFLTGEMKREK